jgi:hypothetical protein
MKDSEYRKLKGRDPPRAIKKPQESQIKVKAFQKPKQN